MKNAFNFYRFPLCLFVLGSLVGCFENDKISHSGISLRLITEKPITLVVDYPLRIEGGTYRLDYSSVRLFFSGEILKDSTVVPIQKLALNFDIKKDSSKFVMPDSIKVTGKQCKFIGEAMDETGYRLGDTLLVNLP